METVLIQINSKKAYKLLENLEDLDIIKVLKSKPSKSKETKKSPVTIADFSGILSESEYDLLKSHTEQIRKEWERNI